MLSKTGFCDIQAMVFLQSYLIMSVATYEKQKTKEYNFMLNFWLNKWSQPLRNLSLGCLGESF